MSNKKYNLIVNYFSDKNEERAKELDFCIIENIRNVGFNKIVVICSELDYIKLLNICSKEFIDNVLPIITELRPSYNDYFSIISKLFSGNENINIIANLDIIIPVETLLLCENYLTTSKICLALSRWDINKIEIYQTNPFINSALFNREDSQDTWIFIGDVPQISGASFSLGKAGCDNSIAYLLQQSGYNVINPSRKLKTYHLHLTNIRNYTNPYGGTIDRVLPPYKLIPTTE